jgi:hypothetical protein
VSTDAQADVAAENIVQQPTVALSLSDRVRSQVMRDRNRCTGISSNALTLYGVKGGPEPRLRDYPSDLDDLRSCERVYLMAPDEVRERMLPVLVKYRDHVAENRRRYGTGPRIEVRS